MCDTPSGMGMSRFVITSMGSVVGPSVKFEKMIWFCWNSYWISNDNDYLKFNIFCTLGLKIMKTSPLNLAHWTLANNMKNVAIPPRYITLK